TLTPEASASTNSATFAYLQYITVLLTTEAHFRDFTHCVNTYFATVKRLLQKATFSPSHRGFYYA
ncbi:hypothetical protein, partial [Pantoea sp. Pa-EAmG]|uniref:hypothetical protein n=1 Tax=Pantoea sp. Pa-EAmG TaxID=3043311 RepID=UPI0024AFF541